MLPTNRFFMNWTDFWFLWTPVKVHLKVIANLFALWNCIRAWKGTSTERLLPIMNGTGLNYRDELLLFWYLNKLDAYYNSNHNGSVNYTIDRWMSFK
jgi:hypothetical protein